MGNAHANELADKEKLSHALGEVGKKTRWHVGLIVHVFGNDSYVVTSIKPQGKKTAVYDNQVVYLYTGTSIDNENIGEALVYEIILQPINVWTGGAIRNPREVGNLQEIRNPRSTHRRNVFKSVDGFPPHVPSAEITETASADDVKYNYASQPTPRNHIRILPRANIR